VRDLVRLAAISLVASALAAVSSASAEAAPVAHASPRGVVTHTVTLSAAALPVAPTNSSDKTCWLNGGNATASSCGQSVMHVGFTGGAQSRSLVYWSVGSIPNNATITDSDVSLFLAENQTLPSQNGTVLNVGLHRPSKDWSLSCSTWNKPVCSGSDTWQGGGDQLQISDTLGLTGQLQGWKTWELSEATVQNWVVSGPTANRGVLVRGVGGATPNKRLGFRAGGAEVTWRPKLDITYTVPVSCSTPSTVIYVAPNGSDSNNGGSNCPVRSIQRGVDLASTGMTVSVANGSYTRFTVPAGKDITVDGETEAGVVVDPAGVVGNVATVLGNGSTLSDLTVQNCQRDGSVPMNQRESNGSAGIRVAANSVTVANVTVRLGRPAAATGALGSNHEGCYGILAYETQGLNLTGNDVYDNGAGIYVRGGGNGQVTSNSVYNHTKALIRNTAGNEDYGATGITFDHVLAGSGGFTATGNWVVNNVAPSQQYSWDGGGFEIFASSGITMDSNVIVANDTVLETGTIPGSGVGCVGNKFRNNLAWGVDETYPPDPSTDWGTRRARKGLVLRCDQNMVVSGNTIRDVEYPTFSLQEGGGFGSTISGLSITGNNIDQREFDHVYELTYSSNPTFGLSNNCYVSNSSGYFFSRINGTTQANLAAWIAALPGTVSPKETGSVTASSCPAPPPLGDIYVAPTGNDANAGTQGSPVRSIQKGVDLAATGQTVYVANGSYTRFSVPAGKDITVDGESEAGVVVDPGSTVGNVVTVSGNGSTLSDLTVQNCQRDGSVPMNQRESLGSAGIRLAANNVTVSNVTVRNGRPAAATGALGSNHEGCYGIHAYETQNVNITGNDVYDNGAGIYIRGGGNGLVTGNTVHDHTKALIRNTAGNEDYGAAGITFDHVLAGSGGFTATGNTLVNNVAPSQQYSWDGGGFEIFASSGITMDNNVITGNDTVLETGTIPGSGVGCVGNRFRNNVVTGVNGTYPPDPSTDWGTRRARKGLVLRCDQNMVVSGNRITDVEYPTFSLQEGGGFGSTISGLSITGNKIDQREYDHVYELTYSSNPSFGLSNNCYVSNSSGYFFSRINGVTQANLAAWIAALPGTVSPKETGSVVQASCP
jgi:parallel beta-helix repeat protein